MYLIIILLLTYLLITYWCFVEISLYNTKSPWVIKNMDYIDILVTITPIANLIVALILFFYRK